MILRDLLANVKVGYTVAGGTTAGGMISNSPLGYVAVSLGIVLTLVLIFNHIRNGNMEHTKIKLEISMLKKKETEQLKAAPKSESD